MDLDLKNPVGKSTKSGEVEDDHSSLEGMREISLLETGDNTQEREGKGSPPDICESNVDKNPEESKRSISQKGSPQKPLTHHKATIVVAGRGRSGKSTALRNVFRFMWTAPTSATSGNKVVNVSEVKVPLFKPTWEETDGEDIEEVTLRVIDTPGLGATDIAKEERMKDMKTATQGEDYTLIYCLCLAAPNQIVMDTDENIVKDLQQSLGKEVWNKCVILFTFSDYTCYCLDSDDSKEYIELINAYAAEFQKVLNKIDPTNSVVVKTIFDYQSPEELEHNTNPSEIIAIPVNKKPKNSKSILPGMLRKGQDWTDIVFVELMKKTKEENRIPFIFFRYPNVANLPGVGVASLAGVGAVASGIGAVVGGTIGTAVGAVAGGAVAGPIGMAAGGLMGAAASGSVVAVTKALISRRKKRFDNL